MSFGQAIAAGFLNYINFSGRAGRSEYWFWVLFTVLGPSQVSFWTPRFSSITAAFPRQTRRSIR